MRTSTTFWALNGFLNHFWFFACCAGALGSLDVWESKACCVFKPGMRKPLRSCGRHVTWLRKKQEFIFISAVLVKAWATMWQLWSISHLPWIWHPRTVTVTWWKPHTESCASCVATWTSSRLASAWQLSGFARSAANAIKRKWHSEAAPKWYGHAMWA